MSTPLAMPDHFDPDQATQVRHYADNIYQLQQAAVEWRERQNLKPVGSDQERIHLLVIDQQVDFAHQEGSLFVAGHTGQGAMEDQRRLVEFIYRNLGLITEITCTLDSHLPYQVFLPSAHLRSDGTIPEPYTIISADEYARGDYQVNPAFARQLNAQQSWLQRYMVHYCRQLEQTGKYQLTLWPYHCVIGSGGHRLSGVVDEARLFHAFARGASNAVEVKGASPLTEHYSIFQPEVMETHEGQPIPGAQKNTRLFEKLMQSDKVVIAGEAASHCLAWTVDDLLNEIADTDPDLAQKVHILEDCTSPVVIPDGPDFTQEAEDALQRFRDNGMNVVKSTDPIASW